ncbi:hypothetical protein TVAG_121960 [Trichomonas vaginalis G3]|uniref:Uncharacterized protein n=1 Tax=Trichomonas vaginalis (strain ATCC PRA-98 / G3) TaxID=412133 RepID=A2E9A7_TRIV3|nr:hypothetical protein TVAGG3_0421230 [Trichomonas vaginalis G3]EAY10792.1 hypothetical protein TVAG_121960 [Trichomonas vaginalis G3]KAI5536068.1 hypothetical protein TVAGG3_0421230 [Trichomonas vaginalis G3]|eukprot:XP_001323015.1 hypothetical protein [Trichomonas vaginalis G3]
METTFEGIKLKADNEKSEVIQEVAYNSTELTSSQIEIKIDSDLEDKLKDKVSLVFRFIPKLTFSVHVKVIDDEDFYKIGISYKSHKYEGYAIPNMIYPGIVICKDWINKKESDEKESNEKNLQIQIGPIVPKDDSIIKIFAKYDHKWQDDDSDELNIFEQIIHKKETHRQKPHDDISDVKVSDGDIEKACKYYKEMTFYDHKVENLVHNAMSKNNCIPPKEKLIRPKSQSKHNQTDKKESKSIKSDQTSEKSSPSKSHHKHNQTDKKESKSIKSDQTSEETSKRSSSSHHKNHRPHK